MFRFERRRIGAMVTSFVAGAALVAGVATPASASSAPSSGPSASAVAATGITSLGPGSYLGRIRNVYTGKCVGISTGLAGDWTCTTNLDQQWYVGFLTKNGYIQIRNDASQCLAVNGGSTTIGARILGYSCNNPSDDEFWKLVYVTGAYFQIVNLKSGKLIGIGGASTSNGAGLVLWDDTSHTDQLWYFY